MLAELEHNPAIVQTSVVVSRANLTPMQSHYPRFRSGALLGAVHKLGGLPWGFPSRLWPMCEECRRPMSHVGQFPARSAEPNAPVLPLPDDEVSAPIQS